MEYARYGLFTFFFRQRIKQPNREKGRRIPRPAGKGRNGRPVGICSVTNAAGAAKRRQHELVGGLVTSFAAIKQEPTRLIACMLACIHAHTDAPAAAGVAVLNNARAGILSACRQQYARRLRPSHGRTRHTGHMEGRTQPDGHVRMHSH